MTFSLDLVRDSVQADVSNFLGQIEERARLLADLPFDWPAGPALETIGVCCHGLAGTTSLVGIASMSSSARLLEHLAEVGKELVAELELMAARTRELGGLYLDGAQALRAMLAHELSGQGDAAGALSGRLNERIEVARAGDLRLPPPASSTAPRLATGPTAAADIPAELSTIFRDEARDAATTAQALLVALRAGPSPAAAEPLERLFHTLKGAAATVGLADLAERAKALQLRLATVADGDEPLGPALVAQVVRDASQWFAAAGVPAPELGPSGPEPRDVFRAEALRLLADLERQLERGERDGAGEVFHLLKGSALVVGEQALAARLAAAEHAVRTQPDRAEAELRAVRASFDAVEEAVDAPSTPAEAPAAPPIDPELWEAFDQECRELLDSIDRGLLELDQRGGAALAPLFRQYHTLKGALNTIGLAGLGAVVHDLEDEVAGAADGPGDRGRDRLLVAALLEGQRLLRRGLEQARRGRTELDRARLDARLRAVRAAAKAPASHGGESLDALATAGPDSVDSVDGLGSAGSATGATTGPTSEGSAAGYDPEGRRYVRVALDRLDALMNLAGELVLGRSRLVERTALLRAIQRDLRVGRQRLVDTVERFSAEHEFANLDGRRRPSEPAPAPTTGDAPMRVAEGGFSPLELDRYEDIHVLSRSLTELSSDFRDLDGELVRELTAFHEDADRLGSIVSVLQGEITRARMIAVETVFARLRLPIREAAERERKDVAVTTSGESVALDKAIADALFAPLLHLVRNAVGHGIESAEQRRQRGKPAAGTITLAARQEAGQIVIEVADDGRGLDRAALRARGVEAGLLAATVAADAPVIDELVFAAGISTTETVGAVSGRGIGGNVVRRTVERLGGSVRVQSSASGTRFTITLPMTLAITRAVVARVGDLQLAIPLSFAHRVREAADAELVSSAGIERLLDAGAYVPVTPLRALLEQGEGDARAYVVVRLGDESLALAVDAVLGQEEIVIKPLGSVLDGHSLFAGVTFRGSGDLALVLDVPGLVERGAARADDGRDADRERGERGPRQARPATEPPTLRPGSATDHPGSEPTGAPTTRAPVTGPATAANGPLRVLFVDDSISVRKVAERTLTELGVEVTVAVDGVDGLERLRASRFDLVFTDLEMPRMHGYDLMREIRYVPAYAALPVIVVSSRSGQKHQDQARSLGASDYVTKPFSPETLAAILRRWGRRG